MNLRGAVLGIVIVVSSSAGCLSSVELHDYACENGECLAGYVCDLDTGRCVRAQELGGGDRPGRGDVFSAGADGAGGGGDAEGSRDGGAVPEGDAVLTEGDAVLTEGDAALTGGDAANPGGDGVAPGGDDVRPVGDDAVPNGDNAPGGDNAVAGLGDAATGDTNTACTVFYFDEDGDGYGLTGDSQCLLAATGNYRATQPGDCRDVPGDCGGDCHPGHAEWLDDEDNDCNGSTDECAADCNCGSTDLVACYTFDSRDATDGSGYGNNANANNVAWRAGVIGDALELDPDNNGQVSAPDSASLDFSTAITLEAWIYAESIPAVRSAIVDNNGQWGFFIYPGGDFGCALLGGASGGAGQVVTGEWMHLACSWDGATTAVYKNGVLLASVPAVGTINTANTDPMAIGMNSPTNDSVLDGAIDQLKVWRTAAPAQYFDTVGNDRR